MVIFCEECGERYIVEDEEIKGSAMIFICNVCNEIIRIPAKGTETKKNQREETSSPAENI